ncbi:Venom carboxylesterase6like [Caligus rogercresseyi]|uniref:Venom carboxylesterase6like n=1 Tax=Caligus rogercresseyi TaxID=217165 RepID=A0A7T8JSX2_CALRO|nr:Venom carboxylesterase6like [Caligus rogercresseyi]
MTSGHEWKTLSSRLVSPHPLDSWILSHFELSSRKYPIGVGFPVRAKLIHIVMVFWPTILSLSLIGPAFIGV